MSLIPSVGKKSLEIRLIIALIYFVLIIGGVTMVYPFLIMVSGSFKGPVDINNYNVVPRYLFNKKVLFRKYLESKYNESTVQYNMNARQNEFSFDYIKPPVKLFRTRISDWREFLQRAKMPVTYSLLGDSHSINYRLLPEMDREYRGWISRKSKGSIETYDRRYDAHLKTWLQVHFPQMKDIDKRKFKLSGSKIETAALKFKSQQPSRYLYYLSLDGKYVHDFLYYKYGRHIKAYNRVHGTDYQSYSRIFLSRRLPENKNKKEQQDWLGFVRKEINLQFIRVAAGAKEEFTGFLKRRYEGKLSLLNKAYGTDFADFSQVSYPKDVLHASERLVDWNLFIRQLSGKYLSIVSPETRWRDFLRDKYKGDLGALNQAHEADYKSFAKVPMPTKEVDYAEMLKNSRQIRWEFVTRNYKMVIQYFLLHGRALYNTFVYIVLAIIIALTVTPSAAYAMSRYKLPSTYKVLLFFLATMAFPPMVTTIPNFLLLKRLGLLNTFWALVLPGMTSGYFIFLLKGFFDSLPRELYEAAMIDGAGEWVMFWNITMTLSKPILAVIALGAFTAAYGNFMFAFIVNQNQKMWTLMVWLYQLQQFAHQSVIFAALIIAAIPTFLVFLFAQNIILRGIVVPTEK